MQKDAMAVLFPRPMGWGRIGLHAILMLFAVLAVMFSVALAQVRISDPGYDFRYFWVAGRVWLGGLSPYGPEFSEIAGQLIPSGHIPELWPYPPNLFLPTVAIGLFDFHMAWTIWLFLRIVAMIAASAVLAFAMPARFLPGIGLRRFGLSRLGFFALHLVIVAGTEAANYSTISGQFSDLVYLALCLALVGVARGNLSIAVAGALAVTFMKPQIGGILAIGLVLAGRQGIVLVARATLVSALLLLPALFIRPLAIFDWLHVLGSYDGANVANLPVAMTGLRNLAWVCTGAVISNMSAFFLAGGVAVAVALHRRSGAGRTGADEAEGPTNSLITMTLVALAVSPLHIYDFCFFGVAVLGLVGTAGVRLGIAVAATAVIMRPAVVYLWFSGGFSPIIFGGSTFATVAALILLLLVLTRPDVGRAGKAVETPRVI